MKYWLLFVGFVSAKYDYRWEYARCQNETIRAESTREKFFVQPSFPNVNNAEFDCIWRLQAPELLHATPSGLGLQVLPLGAGRLSLGMRFHSSVLRLRALQQSCRVWQPRAAPKHALPARLARPHPHAAIVVLPFVLRRAMRQGAEGPRQMS